MPRDVERAEIDGVPVFWAPVEGAFSAALMFRVGTADETLPTLGITHLVEHLALFASSSRPYEANGLVDPERCIFHATGDRDDVLAWLGRCAAALSDLPLDRLETERRVLGTEAAGRQGGGSRARLMDMRFGATSYGLAAYDELGLRWLGPDEVAGWARTRFTRGNAALWMTGEPPAGFELPLHDGDRLPPPAIDPLPFEGRGFLAAGTGGIAVGGVTGRSTGLHAAMTIAGERLYQRLRIDLGLVYQPYVEYEPLGGETAHVIVGAECPDDRAGRVAEEAWRVIVEVGEDGVTADELAEHRRQLARVYAEPDAVRGWLDHAAGQHLLGAEPYGRDEVIGELDELAPEELAAPVAAAFEPALLLLPAGAAGLDGFTALDYSWPEPVGGESFELGGGATGELRVGDEGVSVVAGGSEPMTVRWETVVLVERAPGGTLVLTARNGSWLELHFGSVRDGERAREAVLGHVPAEAIIPAAAAETVDALDDLAGGLAGAREVTGELLVLTREITDDEAPQAVLTYRAGDKRRGLLALTDRRLLRLCLDEGESAGEGFARDTIRSVELRRRRLRPDLLVVDGETELALVVDDSERAEAFAAAFAVRSRP
jgi:hypothetical protein